MDDMTSRPKGKHVLKKLILYIILSAFIISSMVYAQSERKSRPITPALSLSSLFLRLMDLNKDGQISLEENQKFFAEADLDRNGMVDKTEINKFIANRRRKEEGPGIGQEAPDFTLKTLDGEKTVTLSQYKGKKPVVLVFGSYTLPTFRTQAETLERIYQKFKSKSEWLFVYIRESHTSDESQLDVNIEENIVYKKPQTYEERLAIAKECYKKLGLTFTAVVDDIDNKVEEAYAAWPDRLYIVDKKGKIYYKGKKGHSGFNPEEMSRYLTRICAT
ncbi:redoxin domain-containing protein [Candidatus Poribacteria bacterium]|nr:redoxin domain-containing protein [Candidatus Poribacteria bacterium]